MGTFKKITIGNDFKLILSVYRLNSKAVISEGVPEGAEPIDLTDAQNISLVLCNSKGYTRVLEPTIDINILAVEIPMEQQEIGAFYVVLDFDKVDIEYSGGLRHYRADWNAFEIVAKTACADSIDDVSLVGVIYAGKDGTNGKSNYELAVYYNGFVGTEAEYVEWTRKPSVDAADLASTAAGLANTATINANNSASNADAKAILANNAAINADAKASLADQKATLANNAAIGANTATGNANTATANANNAALAANSLAGTYNVTVAMPLGAGLYYNSATARAAVPTANRLLGRVITYATASGVWYSEKYIGTDVVNWTTEGNWERVPDNSQLVQLGADLNQIPDNLEPAIAEILNQQNKRIEALENLIKNMLFKSGQFDTLEVVKEFNIYGKANLYVIKDTAPSVVPDFWGQVYINTSGAGTIYQAKGISSTSDWKQTSN